MARRSFPPVRSPAIAAALLAAIPLTGGSARADVPAATDPQPTRVTLHLHDVAFEDAVARLAKQASVTMRTFGGNWPHVTIDADAQPFWQVLSSACDQAHAGISNGYDGQATSLQLTNGGSGRRVVAGPVLATFRQVEHLNESTAPAARADFCEVAVDVLWEPRLTVAYELASGPPDEAVDENGRSLVPDGAAADVDPRQPNLYRPFGRYQSQRQQGWNGGSGVQYSVRLAVPPTAGRRIAHLRGTIKLWVGGPEQQVEITDLSRVGRNHYYPLGDSPIRLRVANVSVNGTYLQAQLAVPRAGTSADAWAQSQVLLQGLKVRTVDGAGHDWGTMEGQFGYGMGRNELDLYAYVMSNGDAAKPAKLVVSGPVTATELDIPYDLRDLPLP
jgi:hypothetical protein